MIIRIQAADFDIAALNRELLARRNDVGAIASFIGLVRDLEGDSLQQMTLEHYPGMTEKALQGIAEKAQARWQIADLAIIHRVGALKPADQIVMYRCSAPIEATLLPSANSSWIILKLKRRSGKKRPVSKALSGSKPEKVTYLHKKSGIVEPDRQIFDEFAIYLRLYE